MPIRPPKDSFIKQPTAKYSLLAIVVLLALLILVWRYPSVVGETREQQPLYWVSAMDPNYRSNVPGQCPHGMDLIPVYAEDANGSDSDPGVVTIVAEIQNQMSVRKAEVKSGRLKQVLRTFGRVVPDRKLITKLSPRVSGWIDMLFIVSEGEAVKQGQPLYALYSPELIAAQTRFLTALRGRSQAQILTAETELRALQIDDIAIARLRREGAAQQSVIFHAPKDGMVDMLQISEGDYIEPGQMVMAIGSMETVWVELTVLESEASLIKPQQSLRFTTPAHPGLVWDGEVDYISPALDTKTRGLGLRVRVENPRMLLRPNMYVQALLALPQRQPALLVPHEAVINLGQQQRVILDLGGGRFKSVEIVIGASNSEQVEVLEGLREGDVVVTSAQFLIDSESSKTSDFKRMEAPATTAPEYPPTWVIATIEDIDPETRQIRLQHEAIERWGMPGMTMNFQLTGQVKIDELVTGERLRVRVAAGDPLFQVLDIQPIAAGASQ